jgi:biopolymer transport protein ExbD
MAHAYGPDALISRKRAAAAADGSLCEINTTPLIDVMLVLLVTLIITLPIMTRAVKLNLSRTPPAKELPRPDVIELDVEYDGTVVWNGSPVGSERQLESYFRAEAQRDVQPEFHLRADRRVKYDFVAKTLASAQRNGIQKMGFADTGEFAE